MHMEEGDAIVFVDGLSHGSAKHATRENGGLLSIATAPHGATFATATSHRKSYSHA